MKVEQQKNAILCMVKWLTHENELGHEPFDIEIESFFMYEGEEYVILKYQAEENGDWLFGVCGGYTIKDKEHSGIVWSEMEIFDKAVAQEKCIQYIDNYKKQLRDYLETDLGKVEDLTQQGKWEEVVSYVDSIIDKYKMPREENGVKLFQHPHNFDFLYAMNMDKNIQAKLVKNDEYRFLNKKLFALIELKRNEDAEKLVDEILEIVPNYAPIMFERIEIFKNALNLEKYKEALDKTYDHVWHDMHFGKFLRLYAWYYIEKEEYENGIYLLSASLFYDDSDYAFNYCNNEIEYIKGKLNKENIQRPSYHDTLEFLRAKNLPSQPSKRNWDFSFDLYDYCMKEKLPEGAVKSARANLVGVHRGWDIYARMIEVNHLTPNHLICNYDFGFDFQISKQYNRKEKTEETPKSRVYEFEHAGKVIRIDTSKELKDENEYDTLIKSFKQNNIDKGFEIINESKFVGNNGISAEKALVKGKQGNMFVIYWFKFTKNLIGRISAAVEEDHSEVESDIIEIISTWKYM